MSPIPILGGSGRPTSLEKIRKIGIFDQNGRFSKKMGYPETSKIHISQINFFFTKRISRIFFYIVIVLWVHFGRPNYRQRRAKHLVKISKFDFFVIEHPVFQNRKKCRQIFFFWRFFDIFFFTQNLLKHGLTMLCIDFEHAECNWEVCRIFFVLNVDLTPLSPFKQHWHW